MSGRRRTRLHISPEIGTFLAVGGLGYIVDVAMFNLLRSYGTFATADPALARSVAVIAATGVTYLGNRRLTWRHVPRGQRSREVGLFLLFNILGFGISLATLAISHDLMGLTSRLADNVSANIIGVGLGTAFRFATYKYVVFQPTGTPVPIPSRSPCGADAEATDPVHRSTENPVQSSLSATVQFVECTMEGTINSEVGGASPARGR